MGSGGRQRLQQPPSGNANPEEDFGFSKAEGWKRNCSFAGLHSSLLILTKDTSLTCLLARKTIRSRGPNRTTQEAPGQARRLLGTVRVNHTSVLNTECLQLIEGNSLKSGAISSMTLNQGQGKRADCKESALGVAAERYQN